MPENFTLLGHEVERLVTAPYAPSLQDLHDIVQRASSACIQSWASHKPCQLGALADILVDGLSRSSYALSILEAFAHVESIRNVLLVRYPHILDQFLQRAVEDAGPKYIAVSTAMLSSSLPDNFVIPARFAPFLTRLIHSIGESPCAETILPIYQLTTGLQTSPRALFEIPSETMSSLQVELTKVLRNFDDHMGNLLCLATFAQITSSQNSLSGRKDIVPCIPPWLQSIQHFFGPKRGLKTLDLVVLRVILVCSSSCSNLTTEQAAESIRLAIDICDTVEQEQKSCWIQTNKSKISKLCEKLARQGVDDGVQALGVAFLVSLVPAITLPHEILQIALKWLVSENSEYVFQALPSTIVSRLVEASTVRLGKPAVCSLLDYVLSVLSPQPPREPSSMSAMLKVKLLLSGMQNMSKLSSDPAVSEIVVERCKGPIDGLIKHFPMQPYSESCEGSSACYSSIAELENELLCDMLTFYIHASFWRSKDKEEVNTDSLTSLHAFMTNTRKLLSKKSCAFQASKPSDARATLPILREVENTIVPRTNWREGIAETMMANARTAHDNMMRQVEDICYDLERRCQGIEAPLRAVEQERDYYIQEAGNMKQQNQAMESQVHQANNAISQLHQDISRLESHAGSVSLRVQELSENLDTAQRDLEDQKRASEEDSSSEREKARSKELELIAAMTEKEDCLEEAQEELRQQRMQNDQLRGELEDVSRQRNAALEGNDTLRDRSHQLERSLEEKEGFLVSQQRELQQLLSNKESTEHQVQVLQEKLDEEISKSASYKSALHKAEEDFKLELESTRKQLESLLSTSRDECANQKEEILSMQASMQAAASTATKEIQTKDKRIQYLEKKIQHLRDERSAKAREFSEAQQHIGRLMSVMGFKPSAESPPKTKSRSKSIANMSQISPTHRQTHPDKPNKENLPTDDESDTSQLGRSPKRSRNSTFSMTKSPSSSQSAEKRGKGPGKSATRSRHYRKVLGNVDQNSQSNSQHSTVPSGSPHETFPERQFYGNVDENRLREIDLDMDLELTKDFLFTSTSLSQNNDFVPPQGAQNIE